VPQDQSLRGVRLMSGAGWEDITRVIFLTSSTGELVDNLPVEVEPVAPNEEELLYKVECRGFLLPYVVQLPDGKRGILLAAEIANPGSEDPEEARIARKCGFATEGDAWQFAESILKEWRRHGLRVFGGHATGPFGRHEIGAFVGFEEPDVLEKCGLADRLANEVNSMAA